MNARTRRRPLARAPEGVNPLLQTSCPRPSKDLRMSSRASVGMSDQTKAALRLAADEVSRLEGRRVSMSELMRRLAAAGGIL